ncbi:glycerol kinase GlpK [Chitinivorax sp. B]|uniref:glycerol kinase GlpK n=1 Tax=Chitinivorax sp. B TaxID=2502235 RepID=UPI0010F6F92A|nr:glycerol kinase GlpK [Chitinivorax sp. B]
MSVFLLAIDQGTTSTRAIVFDRHGVEQSRSQAELTQYFPAEGWVEHDPEEIWRHTLTVCREALGKNGAGADNIAAIGITNQRETTVVWDRATGKPVHHAIVWQDRRTAAFCQQLYSPEREKMLAHKTGLVLDPYFSATKIRWILDNIPGLRKRAEQGELAFGTIDSFLLWRLTGGRVHATDATNAARTMLFNIRTQQWDEELLTLFGIPPSMLPEVKDSAADFGHTDEALFGVRIPIRGIAGDQQAATVGQACFAPGMIKSTYGTGCFMVMNTGEQFVESKNRLLTTVAYRLNGKATYAMEGSIFIAGAAVQWLRDALKLISNAGETEALARQVATTGGVYLVPAFTGLGAPYWDPLARGSIVGLTRDSGIAHIVRAALESVCYQTRDLLEAMRADGASLPQALRVDGGMVGNNLVMQFLSDMLTVPVERPRVTETTALGAAYLAGLGIGIYQSLDELSALWQLECAFRPEMDEQRREALYRGWQDAVSRTRSRS